MALSTLGMLGVSAPASALPVPHSRGDALPRIPVPPGAVDCHHHIFDDRFPAAPGRSASQASVSDYRRFQQRLGLSRSVVIAPSTYGYDNACLLDALASFGPLASRGVAMARMDAPDAELDALHQAGVRGIRLYLAREDFPPEAALMAMSQRLQRRGWHMQFVADRKEELVPKFESTLSALACPVVIDHFGYAPQPGGAHSRTAAALRRLLQQGNTYVKLSGVYIQSREGFPHYSDMDELAAALIALAPARMLWGSDWPHPGVPAGAEPDDAMVLDRLALWSPDPTVRDMVLVANPDRLYWSAAATPKP